MAELMPGSSTPVAPLSMGEACAGDGRVPPAGVPPLLPYPEPARVTPIGVPPATWWAPLPPALPRIVFGSRRTAGMRLGTLPDRFTWLPAAPDVGETVGLPAGEAACEPGEPRGVRSAVPDAVPGRDAEDCGRCALRER
jgi:hypothetical protein